MKQREQAEKFIAFGGESRSLLAVLPDGSTHYNPLALNTLPVPTEKEWRTLMQELADNSCRGIVIFMASIGNGYSIAVTDPTPCQYDWKKLTYITRQSDLAVRDIIDGYIIVIEWLKAMK